MGHSADRRRLTRLAAGLFIALSVGIASCQCMIGTSAIVPIRSAASEQMPAFEVATIKPFDGNGFATPLRFYIDQAFGIPPNITARVIGPDWISNTQFVIKSKAPDAIRDAMQKMTPAERARENALMMQSLLADRFHFKSHFETRELPVYELIVAKGGSKLKEDSDITKRRLRVGNPLILPASPIQFLIGVLECNPEIGGRGVVDKTGLTGSYDISLKWAPMQTATAAAGESTAAPSPDEGPSLFTAIEEQLGLKLVPTKAPSEVLVIDHIEQPTPN